ncbi:MAG: carbohydrate binding family 9 domain-containing protein [Gemmatimonadaceae bacterium]|nr:carbohydrate binding family 9 domain-containing protein [Gemmatimonadaceae bacterium]NUQ94047.1 carbohydrate binding family 9 domain-containing protein [Gemmatimonadaceae bacterium]NUS98711.1 carbohydrate binding family 9 domain-containing protein [Gemmatimonadaceae bacterium]
MRRVITLCALVVPAVLSAQANVSVASASHPSTDPVAGARPAVTANTATAVRANDAIVLDGRGTDAVWERAPEISAFREFEPNEDGDPKMRTTAKVAFDDHNLYVFVHAYDPHPDSIVGRLTRRDQGSASDWLIVLIDSYNDHRTGFEFHVNPAGVKRDMSIINDGEEDDSWDAVWDVQTAIVADGWTAEFRIPFSQLRFPPNGAPTFGMMFGRKVGRTNEGIAWPALRKSKGGLVSQFAEVSGFAGLASPRRLEVTPYTVMKSVPQSQLDAGGAVAGHDRAQLSTMGADIKYGVTSNLTLDATINPDFGQVEADPSNLNLTAFETFYSERRPFFMEGAGLFRFDLNCNDGTCSGLFYSRRIGRRPQLNGDIQSIDPTASVSNSTPILGAAKLTGRTQSGLQVGFFDAVTEERRAYGNTIGSLVAEPRTNYLVGRVAQDFRGGKSAIGIMATSTNRSLDDFTRQHLGRSAYVLGLDGRHRFWKNDYEVTGFVAASRVQGTADAISLLQTSSRHQYDRPDDDLTFDPTRTAMNGSAEQLSFNKVGGGITRFNFNFRQLSPGFEVNDVGYLSRADTRTANGWVGLQFNKPTSWYRMARLNFNQWNGWTTEGLQTEMGGNVNFHVQLPTMWWFHMGASENGFVPVYDDRASRGGPAVRYSPSFSPWFGFAGDDRKRLTPYFFSGAFWADEGASHGFFVDPQIEFRASDRLKLSAGPHFQHDINDSQWFGRFVTQNADSSYGTHYGFARLDQRTLSMTTRMDYTATPTLTMQLYLAPYVTVGSYRNLRELKDPRAARYADRFQAYTPFDFADTAAFRGFGPSTHDFNYKALNTNAVLRWEYRPGSTIFFVWQQGREQWDRNMGSYEARRDYRDLFRAHPDNTFLIKASYWFTL